MCPVDKLGCSFAASLYLEKFFLVIYVTAPFKKTVINIDLRLGTSLKSSFAGCITTFFANCSRCICFSAAARLAISERRSTVAFKDGESARFTNAR